MRWASLVALGVFVVACTEDVADFRPKLKPNDGDDDDDSAKVVDAGPGDTTLPPDSGAPDAADAAIASTTCTVSGLALCFAFDGSSTDGSMSGIKATVSNVSFVPGKNGMAASFGAGSSITFEPNAAFDLPAGAATTEAWIKRTSTGVDAVIFDDDGRFSLTISAAGKVLCQSSGGAVTGATDVLADDWAHVACVVDGTTLTAYLNGVADGSGPGGIAPNPTLAAALGQNSPDGEHFLGLIDSFRLLSVARSAADIAADAK